MAKSKKPQAAPPPAASVVVPAPQRLHILFAKGDLVDPVGQVDGYSESYRFRDALDRPALNYYVAAGSSITWWTDRPFVFFPETMVNWQDPSGYLPRLFLASGQPAAFGSVQEAPGSANQIVRLQVQGLPGERLYYMIVAGKSFPPVAPSGAPSPIPSWAGSAPVIVRATIVLQA